MLKEPHLPLSVSCPWTDHSTEKEKIKKEREVNALLHQKTFKAHFPVYSEVRLCLINAAQMALQTLGCYGYQEPCSPASTALETKLSHDWQGGGEEGA